MNNASPPLVTVDWLASRLNTPRIVTLDATFFLPNQNRDSELEFRAEHIPGARFFDIDKIADLQSPLPHMLPSPKEFAEAVGKLGVDNDTHVVAYDNNSFMASARVWWTFRVFGHDRVSVLDGGLKRWKSLNMLLESGVGEIAPRRFNADYRPNLVSKAEEILHQPDRSDMQIIDARSAGRFAGTEKEPRPGLRSGHIPNSLNLPFNALVDPESGQLRPRDEIRDLFTNLGVSLEQPVTASCGSGVTASILALALYCVEKKDVAVYDGSWSEWGARSDTPVASADSASASSV